MFEVVVSRVRIMPLELVFRRLLRKGLVQIVFIYVYRVRQVHGLSHLVRLVVQNEPNVQRYARYGLSKLGSHLKILIWHASQLISLFSRAELR